MKKTIKFALMACTMLLLSTAFVSAQHYDDFYNSCEYDDRIVIVNDYGNDGYRNNHKRSRKQIRRERQWKARILQRAYAIAEADGRVTKRERREIRKLEDDLGIYRNGRNGRNDRHRTREYRGHRH